MARKGSQSKSGTNHASPNRQNTTNGDILNTPERDAVHSEDPSSHLQGKPDGSGGNSGQKTRTNNKNNRSNDSSLGKSDDIASCKQQPVDTSTDTKNPEERELPFNTTKLRRDSKKSSRRGFGKKTSVEQTPLRILTEQVKEKTRQVASMAASFFRASMMYVMEESKVLIERNRPAITAFMAMTEKGRTYVLSKTEYVYPIVRAWMFSAGKLMLLLLTVWLDCNIRGFDSLLRLGTNSLLAVLWCSMLSIFAMIGITKTVMFMAIAASVAAFVGLGFAVLIVAVLAVVILWLYGSFWITSTVIIVGGASFLLKHERFALFVTCLYSMYCARSYIGWLGLLLSLNLSFFSSDVLVQFLKKNVDSEKFNDSSRNSEQNSDRSGNFFGGFQQSSKDSTSQSGYGQSSDRGPGDPSTSGAEKELTSEDEVARLLNCTDHYSAFGFRPYEVIDVSLLKREYKKKAMLVHPDKNMGNDKAADAFKKLQNAYEVLLDSLKRKTYDDELRREELLNYFRRFQGASQKKGGHGTFYQGFSPSESRNLIEPDSVNLWIGSMHDVVRSFAQYVARGEALTAQNGETDTNSKLSSQKYLQLSIENNGLQSGVLEWRSLQGQKSLRTLISIGKINMKPGDSFVTCSNLRTLHIESMNVAALVESLHELKHLRYLALIKTDISALPRNIAKMKLLQYISVRGCESLVKLPDSIVKLGHLRILNLAGISKDANIPRGFCELTSMRRLGGFRARMNGDWCSLEELGPLSQLRLLAISDLENVSIASYAANARIGEKKHLTEMLLSCASRLGNDGLVKEKEGVPEEEQQQIQKVFDELCPSTRLEYLNINGYFGQRLPRWMLAEATPLNNLQFLRMYDLACCTQLSDGLCQLPYLQVIQISRAPSIKLVGPGFVHPSRAATSFPRLQKMGLEGLVGWEEWHWEEHVQAMQNLKDLRLNRCKLKRVPPGLVSHARALRTLIVSWVQHLSSLDKFASLVELQVSHNPDLRRITNLPNLQKLVINSCPKMEVLEGVPALQRLVLEDYLMEKLPDYMRDIKPRHLQLDCRPWLLTSVAAGQSGPEWDKFSHVEHVKAYAHHGSDRRKWYVMYTRDHCNLESNISHSTVFGGTFSSSMIDAQALGSVLKMRSNFSYICSLVSVPFLEDNMMVRDQTLDDGRGLSLEDQVAIALRVLSSGESLETIGSAVGMNRSTVSLVTCRFASYLCERANHHLHWPASGEMEEIKSKFDKIHGLTNCCGVVDTVRIAVPLLSAEANSDHEKNDGMLIQVVVDPDLRFTNIWFGLSSSMNQSSILHGSGLFELCEKGEWLNGSKLKVSDGSEVGEYIIGDAEYPLLPWLLTPYQENDLPDSKADFNTRHSTARNVALRALARFKDTWKFLQEKMWRPNNGDEMFRIIDACCILHNIVIDMEKGAGMPTDVEVNYSRQLRQLADENAVRARDSLSHHLISRFTET